MIKMTKTYSQKTADVTRKWILIDASKAPLGRTAVVVAKYLTGKYKPTYTPHIDGGDYVVVINAANTVVTGGKEEAKTYYRHSGYPGSLKSLSLSQVRQKNPAKLIEEAVKGMVPKNKLSSLRMARLKVFPGAEHTHAPQKPVEVKVKS